MIDSRTVAGAVLFAAAIAVSAYAQSPKTEGEVRRVDKDAGKVSIRHGPVPQFDMPAMTMVFRVVDPAMLDRLKSGDRIVFTIDKVGGAFTVMSFEPAP